MKLGAPIAPLLLIASLAGAAPTLPIRSGGAKAAPLPRGVAGHAPGVARGTWGVADGTWWDDDLKRIKPRVWRGRRADAAPGGAR